jgi:ABC-type glycerol-3-phosphate transport system permease component
MRERAVASEQDPRTAVVADASQAVRTPLTYATLITLLAIVPVAIVFLLSQRALVRGLVTGAVKE